MFSILIVVPLSGCDVTIFFFKTEIPFFHCGIPTEIIFPVNFDVSKSEFERVVFEQLF